MCNFLLQYGAINEQYCGQSVIECSVADSDSIEEFVSVLFFFSPMILFKF